jgi:membrane-bound lytic murein transglycosylase D
MKTNRFLLVALIVLCAGLLFMFYEHKPDDNGKGDDVYYETAMKQYRVFNLKIPDNLTFAGEPVPVDRYYVREKLERELFAITFWHSRTILILKRSPRYFPVFRPVFEKHGIHSDFMFLAMAESELSFPVSPAGAAGMWQFLKTTAQQYGLEVSNDVDERYHVEKSTHAACKYLKDAFRQFQSWTMAAAAYNMGAARIPAAMKEQGVDSYYDLVLPEETMRYMYRILAFKIIWENPSQYGFFLRNTDLYYPVPVQYLEVDTSISDLSAFALRHQTNFLVLKDLNPWLRSKSLRNVSRKKYEIAIPTTTDYSTIMNDVKHPGRLMNDTLEFQ